MSSAKEYLQKLKDTKLIREPLLRDAIQALKLPRGSRGLDAGCAAGLQCLLLAEAIGPEGHVTGLDILPELLQYGDSLIEESEFSKQISLKQGDIYNLPFDSNTFDWIWSADCAGYPSEANPNSLVKELARVVKPGGMVVILAYSSQMLLPGYPFLEARLNATCSSYLPIVNEKEPDTNFLRAQSWFLEGGMRDLIVRTFVRDFHAPLSAEIRTGLTSLIEMLWGTKQPEVAETDWREYQRLCTPDSPDFILDLPSYYGFFTYTMFQGTPST
jgi:demethylmenaquinone methyltransferase/2-methoxy-6-polyprenyl-1,4-benzoquinol methylase